MNVTVSVVVEPCVTGEPTATEPPLISSSPLGPLHSMSSVPEDPSKIVIVQLSMYTAPAVELRDDVMKAVNTVGRSEGNSYTHPNIKSLCNVYHEKNDVLTVLVASILSIWTS